MGAGSCRASKRISAPARRAAATWYDSTRVIPIPDSAAAMAASAVLTARRDRIGMRRVPPGPANAQAVDDISPSNVTQRWSRRASGRFGVP